MKFVAALAAVGIAVFARHKMNRADERVESAELARDRAEYVAASFRTRDAWLKSAA